MSRMRSLSFPRINTSKLPDDDYSAMHSPYQMSPTHSRDSSAASSASSPLTPTFSTRGHSRWPSSSSSLVTNPDSPANPQKSQLHDLVEEPYERDDVYHGDYTDDVTDEPLCICDTPFCEHRQREESQATPAPMSPPEWTPGDDYFDDGQLPGEPVKRGRSNEASNDSFSSRLSRHFPSISKRFGGHKTSASVSTVNLRSAPSSRSSSLRLPSTRSFTVPNVHEVRNVSTPSFTSATPNDQRSVSPPRARSRATSQAGSKPMAIVLPAPEEEPTDREELASTPLLPPMMANYFNDSNEAVQSPLQSPTVASAAASVAHTPVSTPVIPGFSTPPLSTKASAASLRMRSSHVIQPSSEIPPLTISEESDDRWAIKLGHANFHITPEPYIPEVCDAHGCRRLLDDWEAARVEYMKQAARVSEHYGVTSQTYKLTEQKWAEIDAEWRGNHEKANAAAQASGEETFFQTLAETQALQKMPSLQDPKQPSKFPTVEESDIVGPMVQYAKIQHRRQPSKKPSFLKIFTDPGSLLSGRPNVGSRV